MPKTGACERCGAWTPPRDGMVTIIVACSCGWKLQLPPIRTPKADK